MWNLLWWPVRFALYVAFGTMVGAMWDRGHPERHNLRDDLPSTVGALAGVLVAGGDLLLLLTRILL